MMMIYEFSRNTFLCSFLPLPCCLFSLQVTCTFPSKIHAFSLSASSLMCPPTCDVEDEHSSVTLSLLKDVCEVKIWQKISGVFDEWKVLNALGENLHHYNDMRGQINHDDSIW